MRSARIIAGMAIMALIASVAVAACGGDSTPDNSSQDGISSIAPLGPQDADTGQRDAGRTIGIGGMAESKGGAPVASATQAANGSAYSTTAGGGNDTQGSAANQLERKIIFNAKLDIAAGDVHAAFAEASRVARNAGGFIDRSSVYAKKDLAGVERTYATLTVRVPVAAYQDVLQNLRTLPGGKVMKEESGSREVTDQYTDLQSRLRNLQRSESQYLTLLGQAKTIQEIMTVSDRIDSIRLQIERIQGQMNMLDDLSDLATIDITMAPPPPTREKPGEDGPPSPRESFMDAWEWTLDAGRYAAAAGAAAAAVAIWLAVPAAVVLAGTLRARRRAGRAS